MKQFTFGIIALVALGACSTDSTFKKSRNLDFNCDNQFKVSFTESTTITNGDTSNTVTVDVKSPELAKEFSMQQVRAASGVKYATKDGKYYFWEHQGEFTFGTEDSTYCLCK